MYFQIGNEKIVLDFNHGITVKCSGPELFYYAECTELRGIDNQPYLIEGYHFSQNDLMYYKEFRIPIEFYMNFEIKLYKFDDKNGLYEFYGHKFNENNQLTKFILDTEDEFEARIWIEKVFEYKEKNKCRVQIVSKFENLNKFSESRFYDRDLTPYKTYRLGRFFKNSQDWKTLDPRKQNLIWYGNWKTFWSYQHPRLWKNLSSEEIANDILGL